MASFYGPCGARERKNVTMTRRPTNYMHDNDHVRRSFDVIGRRQWHHRLPNTISVLRMMLDDSTRTFI